MRALPARVTLAVLFVIAAGACSSDPPAPPPPGPPDAAACPEGSALVGGACELTTATGPCAPGTRPAVGSTTCVPVGVPSCARGFAPDASGWGCAPILPAAACAGASRDALGETSCAPVGDCAAPFPPAGAVTVDPALPDGALDATHVRRIADAAVPANDGKTLALADGAHEVDDTLLAQRLTIVGRCAARARIIAPVANPAAKGLRLSAAVTLRGVTVADLDGAISVGAGGDLTLEDSVVEGAKWRGVLVDKGSKARLTRVVIRGTRERVPREQTIALVAGAGSVVTLDESALLENADAGIVATDGPGTRVEVTRSVLRETKTRSDGLGGSAVRVFEDARVTLTESAVVRASGIAVVTFRRNKPPPEVTLVRSVVTDTVPTRESGRELAVGVNAGLGASARLEESTVRDIPGFGAYASDGGAIALVRSVVLRSKRNKDQLGYGVGAHGGSLTLEGSAVVDTGSVAVSAYAGGAVTLTRSAVVGSGIEERDGLPLGFGVGASARSRVTVEDSSIVGAAEIGAAASGPESALALTRVYLGSRGMPQGTYGHGVLLVDQATATVTGSIVEGQKGAALLFAGAGGVVAGSVVRENAVAVHVQEGATLDEVDVPPTSIALTRLTILRDTVFARNATRVGVGTLPLPAPLEAPGN